jgi:hypothetical protein
VRFFLTIPTTKEEDYWKIIVEPVEKYAAENQERWVTNQFEQFK